MSEGNDRKRGSDRHLRAVITSRGKYRRMVKLARGRPHLICIPLTKGNLYRFVDAAAKRGIEPSELALRIMTAVLEGDLLDAVLDDGPLCAG